MALFGLALTQTYGDGSSTSTVKSAGVEGLQGSANAYAQRGQASQPQTSGLGLG